MSRTPRRRGASLVELLLTLAILGAVLAATLGVLDRQRRAITRAATRADARAQLRHALSPLAADIRGLAPAAGDLVAITDSSIELAATIGAAVACVAAPDERTLLLAPSSTSDAALTRWLDAPEPGDGVLVGRAGEDAWPGATIAAVTTDPAGCAGGPLASAAGIGSALRLALDAPLAPPGDPVPAGAPVRFTRATRWSLYRAADGLAYLGFDDRRGGRWSGVQPVAGPFAPRAVAGPLFRWFARDGMPTSDLTRVARIDMLLATPPVTPERGSPRAPIDSALLRVAIQNAP